MSLEVKSQELKELLSKYNTQWFLGFLSDQMRNIIPGKQDEIMGGLSSPLRQFYFLGGLLITTDDTNAFDSQYDKEDWRKIVNYLNEIELEYEKYFSPNSNDIIDDEWIKIREIAMPSFLSYFNHGPLNFEEQTINWVEDLYNQLDSLIENEIGLKTSDFIIFYNTIDEIVNNNLQGFTTKRELLNPDWKSYSDLSVQKREGVPEMFDDLFEERAPLLIYLVDPGIIKRFKPSELVSDKLTLSKIEKIINLLSCKRQTNEFLYYTELKPGNPLYEKPIIDIGNGLYQVFEVKQIIHAIDNYLELICSQTPRSKKSLTDKKGKLLENNIEKLLKLFLIKDFECYTEYYVDGCEQDILFLYKNYAFIIEAKGYKLNEPFRDPNKAYNRIKNDFNSCISYGYTQTKRVEEYFKRQIPLTIKDKNGNVIKTIDTSKYEDNDFSIIVNLKSFGQIQINLANLLEVDEDDVFPWAVKYDDLEVFILTLIAYKKTVKDFVDYLLIKEELHGKLICGDELEVCGGYITGKITTKEIVKKGLLVTHPSLANIFDEQYKAGMGFKNEKLIDEKRSKKLMFF